MEGGSFSLTSFVNRQLVDNFQRGQRYHTSTATFGNVDLDCREFLAEPKVEGVDDVVCEISDYVKEEFSRILLRELKKLTGREFSGLNFGLCGLGIATIIQLFHWLGK